MWSLSYINRKKIIDASEGVRVRYPFVISRVFSGNSGYNSNYKMKLLLCIIGCRHLIYIQVIFRIRNLPYETCLTHAGSNNCTKPQRKTMEQVKQGQTYRRVKFPGRSDVMGGFDRGAGRKGVGSHCSRSKSSRRLEEREHIGGVEANQLM